MVKVTILLNKKNKKVGFVASGHAESGPKGHDLVCAAISAIVTGGINAIKHRGMFEISLYTGFAKIKPWPWKIDSRINTHDRIVIETMIEQLQTIAESYPKNLTITNKTCKV